MKKIVKRVGTIGIASFFVVGSATVATGCVGSPDDIGVARERKTQDGPGLCRVTGGGRILWEDHPDSFGGNAGPFRTGVDGEWNHVNHEGNHFHGDPETVDCWNSDGLPPDPPRAPFNTIRFTGSGYWDEHDEECTYAVEIEDHGEPGTEDHYLIDITCTGGVSYFASGTLFDGNLQIHAVPRGRLPR